MTGPERTVSRQELLRGDGRRGRPKLIAYRGVVYDVSSCPKWRSELHEGMHFPAQDLTGELRHAPHEEEVFTRPCVKRVGPLQDNPG